MKKSIFILILINIFFSANSQEAEVHFPGKFIESISFDKDGNFWVAPYDALNFVDRYAHLYNVKEKKWQKKLKFEGQHITRIYCDASGRTWFITSIMTDNNIVNNSNDLFVYMDDSLSNIQDTYPEIKNDLIWDITEDSEGGIWLSTEKGLLKFKNNEWELISNETIKTDLNLEKISNIYCYENKLWISEFSQNLNTCKYKVFLMQDLNKYVFTETDINYIIDDKVYWDNNGNLTLWNYVGNYKFQITTYNSDGSIKKTDMSKTKVRVVPYEKKHFVRSYYNTNRPAIKKNVDISSLKDFNLLFFVTSMIGSENEFNCDILNIDPNNVGSTIHLNTNFYAIIHQPNDGIIYNSITDPILKNRFIYDACYNNGKYYFCTNDGIFEYDGNTTRPSLKFSYLKTKKIKSMINFGSDRFIYIDGKKLFINENSKYKDLLADLEKPVSLKAIVSMHNLKIDNQNILWVCTDAGLIKITE